MSKDKNNMSNITVNPAWAKISSFYQVFCEYIGDYFSGNKLKHLSRLNGMNQNQK